MAVPHLPLIEHTVKKGDNLTKIVKKYGHPGSEWKPIYNGYYNKAFKAKFKDPNLIRPGEVFKVPSITRKRLEEVIHLLWDIEDWTKDTLRAHSTVYAELRRLKKERVKTRKTFRKAKTKLLHAYDVRSDVKKATDRCIAADKETKGTSGLGSIVQCTVKFADIGPTKKKMEELGKLYEEAGIDHDEVNKKITEIEKALDSRNKLIDAIVAAQSQVSDYFGRNHVFFFGK